MGEKREQVIRASALDNEAGPDRVLAQVRQALAGLKFGQVLITVQDGVVVQLERIERQRFRRGEKQM